MHVGHDRLFFFNVLNVLNFGNYQEHRCLDLAKVDCGVNFHSHLHVNGRSPRTVLSENTLTFTMIV